MNVARTQYDDHLVVCDSLELLKHDRALNFLNQKRILVQSSMR